MENEYQPPASPVRTDAPGSGRRRRFGWNAVIWASAAVLALVAATLAVLALVHVPYAVLRPGPVQNALGQTPETDHPIIKVEEKDGVKAYEDTDGDLYFTTVSVMGGPAHPLSVLGYLIARTDPDAVIKPVDEVFDPHQSAEQVKEEDRMMMASSQDGAHIVAARAAGYPVTRTVGIAGVLEVSPNADLLKPEDDLLVIDGKKISTPEDLRAGIEAAKPGGTVELTIRRDGKESVVRPKVTQDQGRKALGIMVRYQYDTPVQVAFDAGSVGGPSAGMMFSLALYDKLTPGPLTGGKQIAGTGTIEPEGAVGPIGGIQFKLKGAREAGAEYFLAPEENCDEVKGHVPAGLQVVRVSTFDQARRVTEQIAKGETKDLPSCG